MRVKTELSDKQQLLIQNWGSQFDIAEGSIRSGKTFTLVLKFFLKVMETRGKEGLNFIFCFDTPAFKTIILPVIEKLFPSAIFNSKGRGNIPGPHIIYRGEVILVAGYGTQEKWKKIWGATIKCAYVTEMNLAHSDFIDKLSTRMASIPYRYMAGDLNPSSPSNKIYEQVNKCKLYTESPNSSAFSGEKEKEGWSAYHFYMWDNPIMTTELIEEQMGRYDDDSIFHKTNNLGIRVAAEGLIFGDAVAQAIISPTEIRKKKFKKFGLGIDTAWSDLTDDTISFVYSGLTTDNELIILQEFNHNNRDGIMLVSALPGKIDNFVNMCNAKWGGRIQFAYIDHDSSAYNECVNWRKSHQVSYRVEKAWKKTPNIERVERMSSWVVTGHYLINEECPVHIKEMQEYAWDPNKERKPIDKGDHSIQSGQYGWLPFKNEIGPNAR